MKILYSSNVKQRNYIFSCLDNRTSCEEAAAVYHRPGRLVLLWGEVVTHVVV